MEQRFLELYKTRITCKKLGRFESYEIALLFRGGRWIYEISISEDLRNPDTFHNWISEEYIELTE